LQLASN